MAVSKYELYKTLMFPRRRYPLGRARVVLVHQKTGVLVGDIIPPFSANTDAYSISRAHVALLLEREVLCSPGRIV